MVVKMSHKKIYINMLHVMWRKHITKKYIPFNLNTNFSQQRKICLNLYAALGSKNLKKKKAWNVAPYRIGSQDSSWSLCIYRY